MPDRRLELSPDLTLPLDAVTQTALIFGIRGSGKTATGTVVTEEMIRAGQPVAVIDPMDAWWGLRSSADGEGPGLPVTILGGEHADLPLDPGSGAAVARMVAHERLPVVLSLLGMSKTRQRAFVTDFMEELFRENRQPLHLVVDECDRYAPQRIDRDMARLLGAYEDIVLRGRRFGIGCTSITLRPAALNSAIRSQVEMLIAMRMTGKLDVDAIVEWVKLHAPGETARELFESLPTLPVGTAWVWSPGWLRVMQKIQVRPRATFDSSATPKVGEQLVMPRQFARLDAAGLGRMGARLAAGALDDETGSGKAARPASAGQDAELTRLRQQVTALTAELAEARARPPERVEVPVLAPGDTAALEQATAILRDVTVRMDLVLGRGARQAAPPAPAAPPVPARKAAPASSLKPRPAPAAESAPVALGKPHRAVLAALARFPEGRDKRAVGMLAGYSPSAGHFGNVVGDLRRAELIEPGLPLKITPAGVAALGDDYEPAPEGPALIDYWMGQLGKAEREVLHVLLAAWPVALSKQEIAERTPTGYSPGAGHFGNALGRLRTLRLISGDSAAMTADETLVAESRQRRKKKRLWSSSARSST